jgi:hypothetical protein
MQVFQYLTVCMSKACKSIYLMCLQLAREAGCGRHPVAQSNLWIDICRAHGLRYTYVLGCEQVVIPDVSGLYQGGCSLLHVRGICLL